MASKRMFSLNVVDTDKFLEMPISARLLYYELGMRADDDGFVDTWKKILMFTGLKEDDMKILIAKQFIIPFESGVIVIKHWRLNNYLQKDRTKPTIYQKELKLLDMDDNNVYNLPVSCIHSIDKNSIDKNRIDKNNNISSKQNDFDDEFEALWNIYPNKKGKKDAKRHFIKARKEGIAYETIENGLNNYAIFVKANKIKNEYIKHGSSWFNQRCWEDEYTNDDVSLSTRINNNEDFKKDILEKGLNY